ncbi:MAG: ATP-binding protein, partial [Candidatus Riflebacteria bacterium]|nr:ATP-binding protein [Candidatus Riflebacteria bacterium]
MTTIFDLCVPRQDVIEGRVRDEEFAADLSRVINGTAVPEYADPKLFFQYTHPTRGLKALLETACRRLSGSGGELNSVVRLDTQYGGGKTHSLIALVHAVNGLKGVPNASEFIDLKLLPKGKIRIAPLDGENSDPANGVKLADGVCARSLWGEMAFRLAGKEGFDRVRESDAKHLAPGAETIAELFGGDPVLIVIDEISVYLRKAAKAFPDAVDQFPAFLQALVKAVSATPRVFLVCTLAVRSDNHEGVDAYRAEQQTALEAFAEAESILARKTLQIDPTEGDETIQVLRRRLFKSIDDDGAAEVIAQYTKLWDRYRDVLSTEAGSSETRSQFKAGYPFHPDTMSVLVEKLSSLSTFQRTRGMLRLLARTVFHLWKIRPDDATAIHPHHIDPGFVRIRDEITTRLNQGAFAPALAADISAAPGTDPSTAERLDSRDFIGRAPVTSYIARTAFLHTLAFGEPAQGVSPARLRFSVTCPAIEPSFVETARLRFAEESLYLDDRPGSPLRFRVEPNLTQLISRAMRDIDADELRKALNMKVKDLFSSKNGDFQLIPFPAGPYEVPDDVGDGRPYLVLINYDAFAVGENPGSLPDELIRMGTRKGVKEEIRLLRNNLVFVVADDRLRSEMKNAMRRHLGLQDLLVSGQIEELADHQQRRLKEEAEKSRTMVSIAALQCYRHLFYPSHSGSFGSEARLGHTTIELPSASDSPGNGQLSIRRALYAQKKLLASGDQPDAPAFVRDQTPMKTKGAMTTLDLRNEFRKAANLSILLSDDPLISCIRLGIEQNVFIFREGDLVWGKGDPAPTIKIGENSFVHTLADATEKSLWPRKPKAEPIPEETEVGTYKPVDAKGGSRPGRVATPEPAKAPYELSAEGPLRQALG